MLIRNRLMTAVLTSAMAMGGALLGTGVAHAAPPAPGIIDGEPCNSPGHLQDERTGQHWESLNVSAEAIGPATLTINRTETVSHSVKVDAGIKLEVVSAGVGFDVTQAQAVGVVGSFVAPAEPRGAKWVLDADVRVQDHLLFTCNGGKFVRVGHVGEKLNQVEFNHYMVPPTPYIPG